MTEPLPDPMTPTDCDLADFGSMFFDVRRLLTSDTWIEAAEHPRLGHVLMCLWMESWHQRPAASLPDNDAVLARLSMCDLKSWRRLREKALAGWVKCSDGRLYHPVVAEKALEAWERKQSFRTRTAAAREARAAKRSAKDDETEPVTDADTASVTENVGTSVTVLKGTGTGTVSSEAKASASEAIRSDPDKLAWDLARMILKDAEGLSDKAAGDFFGSLLSRNRLLARDMLPVLTEPAANTTPQPRSYLTKAAEGISKRRVQAKPQRVSFV